MTDYAIFYLVIAFIFVVGCVESSSQPSIRKSLYFWPILIVLVTLVAFRSAGVGSDDLAYIKIFSKVPSLLECEGVLCGYNYSKVNIEYGFYFLLSLIGMLGSDSIILFGITGLLSIYLNLKSIRYFSPYFSAGILIYFSHFFLAKELNAIRMGLATALVFYAATFFTRKMFVFFWLIMLFAVSIHVTSALALIPFLLYTISPGRQILAALSVILVAFSVVFDLSQLIVLLKYFSFLEQKIELYLNSQVYNYSIPLLNVVNVRNLIIVLLCFLFWAPLCSANKYFKIAFYFFFCATFFRILFGDFAILAGRGYAAISMFEYVLIPMLAVYFVGRWPGYLIVFIYALLTLSLNLSINTGWSGGVGYLHDIL